MTASDQQFFHAMGLPKDQREHYLASLSAEVRDEILERLRLHTPTESLETQVIEPAQIMDPAVEGRGNGSGNLVGAVDSAVVNLKRIGPFVISRELGRGAMGIVYRAKRFSDDLDVALKLITPQSIASETHRKMFAREAGILKSLRHKRIVRCIDFGYHDRQFFLAMEYIKCIQWNDVSRLQSPSKQVQLACGIVSYVLEGLQFAHDQSIVHRDVKPGNILIFMDEGRLKAKVADFGLAKNFDSAGLTTLSCDTDTKGTLAYMAPEQIKNARYAGPSCDLYAAGTCLYYYLSGTTPYASFERGNYVQYIEAKLSQQPIPIRDVVQGIDAGLAAIVERALARNPDDRFSSAGEMHDALSKYRA